MLLTATKFKRTNFKFNPNGGQAIDTNAFGADLGEPGRDFDFFLSWLSGGSYDFSWRLIVGCVR